MNERPETVDQYIGSFPEDVQKLLEEVRATIREAAPDAEETISYRMPAFRYAGALVYFAAYKNHIGFYPASSVVRQFEAELTGYKTSKGTIQFPLDQPIPCDLISRIVRFRVQENLARAGKKGGN